MRRWRGLDEVPTDWGRAVVTIGVFDGVHRGHRHLVARAVARARELGLPAVVITFDPNPLVVLRPEQAPLEVSTLRHRLDLLEELGVDATCVLPFTRALAELEPAEFVTSMLVGRLHARAVVVGENFRFGHRAAGDAALLARLGEQLGFEVEVLALVEGPDAAFSSTYVRSHLAAGDVEAAARALGRPHRIEGVVVRGAARGRGLGYPTANVAHGPRAAVPADGVYAGWLHVAETTYPAAISVGTNPTFDGRARSVEAYALDRTDLDLYGRHVAVDFVTRLRGMERFDSVDDLVRRMAEDVDRARAVLAATLGPVGLPTP